MRRWHGRPSRGGTPRRGEVSRNTCSRTAPRPPARVDGRWPADLLDVGERAVVGSGFEQEHAATGWTDGSACSSRCSRRGRAGAVTLRDTDPTSAPRIDHALLTDPDRHKLEGLVVADASVIPVTPRATTNVPTVVVADRIAQALVPAS